MKIIINNFKYVIILVICDVSIIHIQNPLQNHNLVKKSSFRNTGKVIPLRLISEGVNGKVTGLALFTVSMSCDGITLSPRLLATALMT